MSSKPSNTAEAPPCQYQRNERGAWVPVDNPDSIANEITADSLLNWYPIKAWSYAETSSWGRDTDALMPFQRGESTRKRLQLTLDTQRRRFHSIRAEGVERIGGEFTVDVHMLIGGDEELGGRVRHWPARNDGGEGDDLLGTIQIRRPMLEQLVEGLRGGKQVTVGIQMPTYKEAIAHSFDEDWMLQNLYVPYGENIVVDAFEIRVTEEYGMPNEDADVPPPLVRIDRAEAPAAVLHPELLKRVNWGLLLLAVVAVLLIVK